MSWVPLKQEVTVYRSEDEDKYGKPTKPIEIPMRCRVDEGSFLVEYRASGNITSREVVAKARVIFNGLADVKYTDEIRYENELGEVIRRRPKKIDVKRHLNAKPILTEVFL